MDNQDKLFEQFQEASKKTETKDFPAMEKVWARVEDKLDKKDDKKAIALWKKLAVAASLLLFFTLGYQFINNDSTVAPKVTPQNEVVTKEIITKEAVKESLPQKAETVIVQEDKKDSPIKKDAGEILKKSIKENNAVVASDSLRFSTKSKHVPGIKVVSEVTNMYIAEVQESVQQDDTKASTSLNADQINTKTAIVQNEVKEETTGNSKIITSTSINPVTGEKTITGIVSDATGPLPGATVAVTGTTNSAQTDLDGQFTIKAKKGDQLEFAFVGYKPELLTIGKKDKIAITMGADNQALSEVVVTGYGGGVKRSYLPGAVSTVKDTKLGYYNTNAAPNGYLSNPQNPIAVNENESTHSLNKALQGTAPGLSVAAGSEQPGSNFNIQIRGRNTLRNTGYPLYIIDGRPVDISDSTVLDPNNINTITVLKDAEATSIYGSRGSDGVIIITLKKKLSKREIRKLEEKAKEQPVQQHLPIPVSQEEYDSFIENPFETPKNAPLSTFSIDVDNASYTNVRRFINNGQVVPKDAVRVEEMINFFKYQYPQPGDNNPFSINTEYSDCPWNKNHQLLRIGLQGKDIATDQLPASNLVFLIDVSGSMEVQNKLPLLVESMKVLTSQLRKEDKVSIVVYAGAAGMVLPPTKGDKKQIIIDALEKLTAGGSTAGGEGIELAYKTAQENFIKGGNNRVILATDGDFNVGGSSNTDMQTLIEEKRKSGVFLTCLGFGMGNYKDSKMEILSDKGNGNYAYIDNIQEANRFLGKEFKGSMFAIAKDVKIQIEFNPKHVQAYRLIGYENRKLRPEDFKNDAIDAGELGSGHTVTALYEIIPTGVTSEFLETQSELKYTKVEENTNTYNDELATIKFRYKKPDGDKSIEMVKVIENKTVPLRNSTDDFKFSAAVAWFGLKLRDSKLIKDKSSEAIKNLAKEGLFNDSEGYKAEFIRLVEAVK